MGDSANTENVTKPKFWLGVQAEFKKISWPDQQLLTKQTIAVVAISIALGLIITVLDFALQYGVNLLTM